MHRSLSSFVSNSLFFATAVLGVSLSLASVASAQSPSPNTTPSVPSAGSSGEAEKKKEEKLPAGVIASYGSSTRGSSVNVASTDSSPGDQPSPIVGRIKQLGSGQCEVTVENLSKEDSYSVNYAVIGSDANGRESYKRTFASTVGAGRSVVNRVRCEQGLSMQVVLRSGKKVGK